MNGKETEKKKEGKPGKENGKESKEGKPGKENGKESKEGKPGKENGKESKEGKPEKENGKESKMGKEGKENKESKESKENKAGKDGKESKDSKAGKDSKANNEGKESKGAGESMESEGKESKNKKGNAGDRQFTDSRYYTNRELSWILFNKRVLSEARNKQNPLMERVKFLSITASNLDEFFMVRVAALKDMVNAGYTKTDIAGLKPAEQLALLNKATHELVNLQYSTYKRSLVPLLLTNGLRIVEHHEDLTAKEIEYVDQYFMENVYPVLTPMAVDSSRPFPLIRNKSLNIGALVRKKEGEEELEFATVQVPSVLPRIVPLPSGKKEEKAVILLEELVERNIDKLFLNYNIVCAFPFRIMRNADFTIEEEETEDLLKEIERKLKRRQWGQAIRLEVESGIDKRLLKIIRDELLIKDEDIYQIDGPLDLTYLMKMYGLEGFDHLKESGYAEPQPVPELPEDCDIFEEIRKRDILLHHPYQTFAPVVEFIRRAAKDPDVLAIKQTLYRVSGNSPIIAALALAAENGKQVSVLVELKARFDEENNIVWAKMLEKTAQVEQVSRSGIYLDAKYGERLFYSGNTLYAQIIYHVERQNDAVMERRKCALFSLDLRQEEKEWRYEKEMSDVFREGSGQGADSQRKDSLGIHALGKGFYVGIVRGKAFFVIWTEKDEDAVYGYYDLKNGAVRTFAKNDVAYFEMVSDPDIEGEVESEMDYEEE